MVRLNRYNFDDNVKQGKWFVKFFAPWCAHCQKIAPIWEKLADLAVSKDWPAKIAEVDCTTSKDICERYNVKGYPTLLWISEGTRTRYTDDAKLPDFAKFVMTQMGKGKGSSTSSAKPSSGQSTESDERKQSAGGSSAVVVQPLQRLRVFVSNWPTPNMTLNIYIFCLGSLGVFLALACAAFQEAETEEERKFQAEMQREAEIQRGGLKTD